MDLTVNERFSNLSIEEMELIDGGGAWQVAKIFTGSVMVAVSPVVGIGTGIVGGPIAGITAGGGCFSVGSSLIGSGLHK